MFVSVVEIEVKKLSQGKPKGIEECIWKMGNKEIFTYMDSEDRFERPIRKVYKFMLHHSYREGGKTKKISLLADKIRYYDVMDGYYPELWKLEERLQAKNFPYTNIEDVQNMLYAKIDEVWYRIKAEIEETEEYKWIQKRAEILKTHREREANFNKTYGGDNYKYFYDVFGNLRKPDELEQFKQQKINEEEYARKSYENSRGYYNNSGYNGGYSNYNSAGSVSNGNFNSEENEMIRALIASGFKQMSKKLHPDLGGDENKMKLLNNVKDKLDSLYGK